MTRCVPTRAAEWAGTRAPVVLFCPCHSAEFDPADHGAVLAGPTSIPLTELPLVINEQDGTIALRLA